jgi:hypothetical protein
MNRDDRVLAWQRTEMTYLVLRRVFQLCRRFWFIAVPLATFLLLGVTAGLLAVPVCAYLFKLQRDRSVAALQSLYVAAGGQQAYEEMQRLIALWPDIARACGLDQKPVAQALGVRAAAAAQLKSLEHSLAAEAYGTARSVTPAIEEITRTRLGYRLAIRLLDGQTVDNYRRAADALAHAYEVTEVRVSPGRPKVVHLTPVMKDPLAEGRVLTPNTLTPATDLNYVPLGITEEGELWLTPLNETSTVIGGVPGAGKSVAINVLLANVAHRPDVQIIAMDMKEGLEMGPWERRCAAVAFDQQAAVTVLQKLMELHKRRAAMLRAADKASMNNLGYSVDHPLFLVVIDEAAELFTPENGSKEAKAAAGDCLTLVSKIVRLCRATGILIVLATQKPTVDSLPSIIRDNAGSKIAFRCTTTEQAVAILGDSVRSADFTPTAIRKEHKGIGVAADADGTLRRVRGFYISEQDRREVVRRTAHLARPLGTPPAASAEPAPEPVYWDPTDPDDGPDLVLPPPPRRAASLPPDVTGGHFGNRGASA